MANTILTDQFTQRLARGSVLALMLVMVLLWLLLACPMPTQAAGVVGNGTALDLL